MVNRTFVRCFGPLFCTVKAGSGGVQLSYRDELLMKGLRADLIALALLPLGYITIQSGPQTPKVYRSVRKL